jgi:hypothetical protein
MHGKGEIPLHRGISNEEEDGEDKIVHAHDSEKSSGDGEPSHLEVTTQAQLQEGVEKVTISTLSGVSKYYTFKIRGIL